jgi:hypothetical protein
MFWKTAEQIVMPMVLPVLRNAYDAEVITA